MITITNTLSNKKEPFNPQPHHPLKMYVCGVTPYDYAHIGHARVYITFDVMYRLLVFLGYSVNYCRNFTDIDDKLLLRAQKEYGDKKLYHKVASTFIETFQEDMNALNCLAPTFEPRVTDNMQEIITFVENLVQAGNAYAVDGDVYFSIDSFPEYGKLSKQKIKDLEAGTRVEINEIKKNPLDFALWKHEEEGTFWKSPWGWGRPGWHIECSALAKKYLGEHLDIHGGGMDLMFPHHENEIAQSEALFGKPFSTYWMHNAFVRIDKEKMSKSLGNFFTIRDTCKQFDPMVLRFFILNHYYRAPLDFSHEDLAMLQKSYQKLCLFFTRFDCQEMDQNTIKESSVVKKMLTFLCDDLNTPGMFGVVFENLAHLAQNKQEACSVKAFLQQILGLTLIPLKEKEITITPEIQKLIDDRNQARADKDWKKSDELRDALQKMGVDVRDKKS